MMDNKRKVWVLINPDLPREASWRSKVVAFHHYNDGESKAIAEGHKRGNIKTGPRTQKYIDQTVMYSTILARSRDYKRPEYKLYNNLEAAGVHKRQCGNATVLALHKCKEFKSLNAQEFDEVLWLQFPSQMARWFAESVRQQALPSNSKLDRK